MAVTYQQARQHVGKPIAVHTVDGQRHFGMLQSVNQQGIVMRPMQMQGMQGGMPGGRNVSAKDVEIKVNFADQPQAVEGEEVFFAAFALPFLALAALWPYYAYPYGYGYGRYYW
ncbi:MAG: hypothetical protein ACXVDE_07120 [Tumebacillaceae bacterium]